MKRLVTLSGLGLLVAVGCGRPFAIDGGSGGAGGSSSSVGAADNGGAPTGGSAPGGSGGSPVAACKAGVAGECPAGTYCDADESACHACADLSRLRFHGQAFVLQTAPTTAGTTAFYPRVSPDDGALYFTYVDKSDTIPRRRIASAPRKPSAPGWSWGTWLFLQSPVGSPGQDSGPLFLHEGSMLSQLVDLSKIETDKPVLLFDSNRNGTTTTKIFVANDKGDAAAEVSLPSGKRDSDVAAAPLASPPRFYWLSDANSTGQRFVTATATSQATEVKLSLDNGCATSTIEAPWVTADGKLLLFAAAYPEPPACAPPLTGPKHLFAAHMNGEGAQIDGEQAKPLFVDGAMSYDSTPALTPDLCMLLFSRFDATTNGRLYGALRE
ncbi:MAG: hypothetical protein QM820_08575 [Minicystis sp.]